MKLQELDGVLDKMSELRVFFDFGARAVPLLEEIGSFVKEIGPVIEGLRSLVEVTSQKLPKASEQLGKVNESSERASNDILNSIDRMIATIESIQTPGSDHLGGDIVQQTSQKVGAVVDLLAKKHESDEDIIELLNTWHLHAQSLTALNRATDVQPKLQSLHEDCTNIMMSLQVQDITGQQIATVIGLMQAIDDVLRKLLLEASEAIQLTQSVQQAPASPSIEYVGVDERKKMVDSLLLKARSGDLRIGAGASNEPAPAGSVS
jgi:chemotaxis regulatin CheY-phosphate phosphatase CheZ